MLAEASSTEVEGGRGSDATKAFLGRLSLLPGGDRIAAGLPGGGGGGVPPELQAAFEKTARYGNPFGESPKKRDAWTKEAGVEVPVLEAGDSADVLWWVGCFGSFNKRNRKDTVALARLLNVLGVDYGILGNDEGCSGDLGG